MSKHTSADADGPPEYRTWVDETGPDDLQTAIVEGVATATDAEPTDLAPLYEAVDPDALTRLFRDSAGLRDVSFVYAGHRVRLFGDGELIVRRAV